MLYHVVQHHSVLVGRLVSCCVHLGDLLASWLGSTPLPQQPGLLAPCDRCMQYDLHIYFIDHFPLSHQTPPPVSCLPPHQTPPPRAFTATGNLPTAKADALLPENPYEGKQAHYYWNPPISNRRRTATESPIQETQAHYHWKPPTAKAGALLLETPHNNEL